MRHAIKKIGIGLLVLSVGVIVFMFVRSLYCAKWFETFKYDTTVSPFDIFNLLVSSLVAISLGYYITKKLTEERFMKEFLIGDITKIETELENIESILNTNNVEPLTIFAAINKLSHKIERIENTAKLIEFSCDELKRLKSLNFKLFEIATTTDDTNRVDALQANLQLEPIYIDFSKSLRKMVYSVNRI